MIVKSTVCRNC